MNFSPSVSAVNINAQIDAFLKLNTTFTKNTNIGNLWINLPNSAKVIPFTNNLSEQENSMWSNDQAYFIRENLIEPTMRILYPEGEYKKIIETLRPFIPQRDTASLLFAADMCSMENKKIPFDEIFARKKLSEANKNRGLTLYNWLRSEEVIPFDILPFIESKGNYPDKDLFQTFFSCCWEELIQSHPSRIFVSFGMDVKDIRDEIIKRAIFKQSKKIIVYSRGLRNKIVTNLLKNFKISYSFSNKIRWKFEKKKYSIGFTPAIRVEIVPEFIKEKLKKER